MKIDAHHHFWKYSAEEYGWINSDVIRRDFLPVDLQQEIRTVGIDGVISVQARQSAEETRWLLEMAGQNAFIKGVVGWVPLISPEITAILEPLARHPKLVSVRHVLQEEPANDLMDDDAFNKGISALKNFDLRYDLLIFARHLPQAIRFVDRHPQQKFILDHVAKPDIRHATLQPWQRDIAELAKRSNVYCKISGMVTEADTARWTPDQLRPYFDAVLNAFGPKRLMFGSDWPVCLIGSSYTRWTGTVGTWLDALSPDEREHVWSRTAIDAYGLKAD